MSAITEKEQTWYLHIHTCVFEQAVRSTVFCESTDELATARIPYKHLYTRLLQSFGISCWTLVAYIKHIVSERQGASRAAASARKEADNIFWLIGARPTMLWPIRRPDQASARTREQ